MKTRKIKHENLRYDKYDYVVYVVERRINGAKLIVTLNYTSPNYCNSYFSVDIIRHKGNMFQNIKTAKELERFYIEHDCRKALEDEIKYYSSRNDFDSIKDKIAELPAALVFNNEFVKALIFGSIFSDRTCVFVYEEIEKRKHKLIELEEKRKQNEKEINEKYAKIVEKLTNPTETIKKPREAQRHETPEETKEIAEIMEHY